MQPFNFYVIHFSKIKTLFIKCLFAMLLVIYVNNMSLIVTWNEPHVVPHASFLLMGVAIACVKFFMSTESRIWDLGCVVAIHIMFTSV